MSITALTDRQQQVATLVAAACTNKQIAAALCISERRVQELVGAIARRLGADADRDDRVQVAQLWIRQHAA